MDLLVSKRAERRTGKRLGVNISITVRTVGKGLYSLRAGKSTDSKRGMLKSRTRGVRSYLPEGLSSRSAESSIDTAAARPDSASTSGFDITVYTPGCLGSVSLAKGAENTAPLLQSNNRPVTEYPMGRC